MPRDKLLHIAKIADLRPTQITVGFHEVQQKRRAWADLSPTKRSEFLARHMVPVLQGPKDHYFVTDHHHLVRALHEEGCVEVQVTIIKNLNMLDKDGFWVFIDNLGWCHPYNAAGERANFANIPKTIDKLVDDPYRSLAGFVRRGGGFAKDTTPFSEFTWADFFRRRIKRRTIETDFAKTVIGAIELAKSDDAKYLPGWSGVTTDD